MVFDYDWCCCMETQFRMHRRPPPSFWQNKAVCTLVSVSGFLHDRLLTLDFCPAWLHSLAPLRAWLCRPACRSQIEQTPPHQRNSHTTQSSIMVKSGRGRYNTGHWTDDENRLLHVGLERHGRDWVAISRVVGTRCVSPTAAEFFGPML